MRMRRETQGRVHGEEEEADEEDQGPRTTDLDIASSAASGNPASLARSLLRGIFPGCAQGRPLGSGRFPGSWHNPGAQGCALRAREGPGGLPDSTTSTYTHPARRGQ
eukprot:5527442-Pyramimonas_sp.AAC.1